MSINNLPNQFISWHLVHDPEKPTKPKKVPFDPLTGFPIDPHDPRNWRTYLQAQATGHPVGFVLTAQDPYFFLDLDDCRDASGWSAEAVAIYNEFSGAAAEISQSGTGLHVVGRCDMQAVADRRNKFGTSLKKNWLEFYTAGRFIAFGPHGWQGNFDQDCTAQILRIVPKRELVDMRLSTGPVQEYTGPEDDAELIKKALGSPGSIAAAFGTKASFKHLFEGDASILCQVFPSPSGDTYDRSSADAALMSHLAFWTGKDAARMDRIFRTSKLMRKKYDDRPEYRRDTIGNAVALCKKVYDMPRSTLATATTANGQPVEVDEFVNIAEQIEYFRGCVYVRDSHRMLVPGGMMLRAEQFNASYGGKVFQMSMSNSGPTKKAFEAFTENRAWIFPKANSTCFRPLEAPGTLVDGNVNVYFPADVKAVQGDVSPFLDLVQRILPDANDRAILMAYCAAIEQHKGVKFQWAPVLQGAEGNGKTIISRCLAYTVGTKYSHWPSAEDLGNPFNSYLENKLLIAVEEVHMQGRRELLDTLKPLITNDRVEVQPKGIDKRMVDNYANWIMNTNHRDAVLKTQNDRRYAIFFTEQQTYEDIIRAGMEGDYFPRLYDWLKNGGYSFVANYFRTYQIPDALNPAGTCHRAPYTSTTNQAISASLGKAEQEIIEAIEQEEPGFKRGWISSAAVDSLMKEKGIKMARQRVSTMIESLHYKQVCRANAPIMQEGSKRPVLYVRRDLWHPALNIDDYIISQGYAAPRTASVAHLPGFIRQA